MLSLLNELMASFNTFKGQSVFYLPLGKKKYFPT